MNLSSAKLPSGRWGIYDQSRLLATIGCPITLDRIHNQLSGNHSQAGGVKASNPTFPQYLTRTGVDDSRSQN